MKIKNLLLFCKESTYKLYFLDKKSSLRKHKNFLPKGNIKRFKTVHDVHYQAIKDVQATLKASGLKYTKSTRGAHVNFADYDLIITLGGDGTFLDAARNIKNQCILGINSAPPWSVGQFCGATRKTFPIILKQILSGDLKPKALMRLQIKSKFKTFSADILNDILIAHKNPAAMSRYVIQVGTKKEEQRSSGIWIATAAGSSGAICSAGGKKVPVFSQKFQYKPRELYLGFRSKYRLKGAVLSGDKAIKIISLMRDGKIFLDGARINHAFPIGHAITVCRSPHDLKVLGLK